MFLPWFLYSLFTHLYLRPTSRFSPKSGGVQSPMRGPYHSNILHPMYCVPYGRTLREYPTCDVEARALYDFELRVLGNNDKKSGSWFRSQGSTSHRSGLYLSEDKEGGPGDFQHVLVSREGTVHFRWTNTGPVTKSYSPLKGGVGSPENRCRPL